MVKDMKLVLTLLLMVCSLVVDAQTTCYYKLTKTVKDGNTSTNVSGGQFLSFNGNVCYESDKKGNQVNQSRMDYKYSDNGIKVYYGTSYWGSNTTFFFTIDNRRLSVKTSNGDKYVYEQCSAPSGAITCSLIRKRESTGNYVPQPVYPIGGTGGGYYSGGGSSTNSSTSSRFSNTPRTRCPNCTNGRRVYEGTVGYSGTQIRYTTCSECGKRYMSSHTTHRHDRCNTCHGSGYLD